MFEEQFMHVEGELNFYSDPNFNIIEEYSEEELGDHVAQKLQLADKFGFIKTELLTETTATNSEVDDGSKSGSDGRGSGKEGIRNTMVTSVLSLGVGSMLVESTSEVDDKRGGSFDKVVRTFSVKGDDIEEETRSSLVEIETDRRRCGKW